MKKKLQAILCTLTAAVLGVMLLTGCTAQKPASVSTEGSTSMEEVMGILGETYEKDTGIKVTYNPTGSSAGIQAVESGRCDIGLSSRNLKDEEKEKGLEATVLAYDGIAVIVHPDNPVSSLTLEDIKKVFTGEITNWKDLGGDDLQIVCIGRESGSGTRDGFESATDTEDTCKYRQELTSTGDVITTVSNNNNAIGYTSISALKDTVKTVDVEGVSPSEENVKNQSYKIQRPFVLVTKKDAPLSDSAKSFFEFATSEKASDFISMAGVVPAK